MRYHKLATSISLTSFMENLAVYLMTRFLHKDLNLLKLLFDFRSIYYLSFDKSKPISKNRPSWY